MRLIGFSTGALAYSDFRLGLKIVRNKGIPAVELSALRENELAPLVAALDSLDVSQFGYISIHAPSRFESSHERGITNLLKCVWRRGWPIVVHPDIIHDFNAWQQFGGLLLIENMDKRNKTGRTAAELEEIFARLPESNLCFDLGHCRQVDPTMSESYLILRKFRQRLRELHVSEVNSRSTHDPLSDASIGAFEKVSALIPQDVPVILESPVHENEVEAEIKQARLALARVPSNGVRKRHRTVLDNTLV